MPPPITITRDVVVLGVGVGVGVGVGLGVLLSLDVLRFFLSSSAQTRGVAADNATPLADKKYLLSMMMLRVCGG